MKFSLKLFLCILLLLIVGTALGADGSAGAADGSGVLLIDAYQTGGLLALLAVITTGLTALLRKPWAGNLLERLPKRARILVPLVLGCIAAMLTAVVGSTSWAEAIILAFLTGPTAVALHQGIARSLLGIQSPTTQAASLQANISKTP